MGIIGILYAFFHLQEDWKKMAKDFCAGKSYPQICLGAGPEINAEELVSWRNFTVYVEGVMVGRAGSLVEAVGIVMATYYVFNIAYPKELERTLTFFQKAIMKRNDQCKRIMRVIKLIASMNNANS